MSAYSAFAKYYDRFTEDVNYKKRAEYFLSLFRLYNKPPALLLDAACGTGSLTLEFAKQGIQPIGIDESAEMLSLAKEKAQDAGKDILFLKQNLTKIDLYGTVDGAVCALDSVNHLLNKRDVLKFFSRVSLFLEEGCLFIFDMNTIYKHKKILGNHAFIFDEGEVFCAWQNFYDHKINAVEINLDFFEKCGTQYNRAQVNFRERAYETEEMAEMLEKSSFTVLDIYNDLTLNPPKKHSGRIVFVARKGRK